MILTVYIFFNVGGGIIGLTSAYELSKNFKVTLVEKEKVFNK